MAVDLVIDIENTPGALARVAAAISDAGVNIAAATCIGGGEQAELHILVKHAEAARHSLAISHVAVSRQREVVVVDVEDRPGVLADITRILADRDISIDAMIQKEPSEGEFQTDIILLTHRSIERQVSDAIEKIEALPTVRGKIVRIRMEALN